MLHIYIYIQTVLIHYFMSPLYSRLLTSSSQTLLYGCVYRVPAQGPLRGLATREYYLNVANIFIKIHLNQQNKLIEEKMFYDDNMLYSLSQKDGAQQAQSHINSHFDFFNTCLIHFNPCADPNPHVNRCYQEILKPKIWLVVIS
jgi:hypothetical protein